MSANKRDHWNEHAQRWQYFGPPLRPSVCDVSVAESTAVELAANFGKQHISAVLLGVTPELASMQWPENTQLLAVDRCKEMISGLWPYEQVPNDAHAVQGDWSEIPRESASVDLVIGDGCYVLLPFPEMYKAVTHEVARVLKPSGRFVVRVFIRPDTQEDPEQVVTDLRAGVIGSFHTFKWRLAMALHKSLEQGVCVGDVWAYWNESGIDAKALSSDFGWSEGSIKTIDAYRGSTTRYYYPTLAEIREHFAEYFEEVSLTVFDYELAERCPSFVLRLK